MADKAVSFACSGFYDTHVETIAKWLSCNGEVWGVGPTAVFASAAALFLYNELEATLILVGDHAHVSLMEKSLVGFYDTHVETIAKWLSCNGEVWGVGPTAVFASAAALFLYNELEATLILVGDHAHVSLMEKSLVSTMVLGMLALMIHLWVCCMRFFQYYLDTLIRDSPNVLLEMTTAGLLGGPPEMIALGPLTRFLRTQQPQIHITVCWFLSLCYADYVRKHYCQRFNMPYLEQWQTELHERAARGVHRTMAKVNSFVGCVHQRLRGYAQPAPPTHDMHTESAPKVTSSMAVCGSSQCLERRPGELCARLVSQSSETTADAIEKLRSYITTTRCTCRNKDVSCVQSAASAITLEKKSQL